MRPRQKHFRTDWILALALVLSPVAGCSYVSQSAFEAKRDTLDQDGDGAPFGGENKDCDDNNANKAPGLEEIPYDGYDNDCDGADIVDVDGDGFPGIDKETYLALTDEAEWPASVADGPVDCADNPEEWPTASDIFPENPNDPPYDGIDGDCAADNDYDLDGDGFMPDTASFGGATIDVTAEFELYAETWGYIPQGGPVYGDCDDTEETVNPGRDVADDTFYDGIDTNCDGLNDFDADGDGYMPDIDPTTGLAVNLADYVNYLQAFHDGVAPWEELWHDCLDVAHTNPAIADVDPATVFPGAYDAPYDGVDGDCSCCDDQDEPFYPPTNDFDGDGDSFMPDSASDAGDPINSRGLTYDDYVSLWYVDTDEDGVNDYEDIAVTYLDCDDTDPLTFPGGLEVLDDTKDGDCDGDINRTPFGFDTYLWDTPRTPRVVRTDTDYVVVTAADWLDLTFTQSEKVGAALTFPLDAAYQEPANRSPILWVGGTANALPLGSQVDAAADAADFWSSTTYQFIGATGYLMVKRYDYSVALNAFTAGPLEWEPVNHAYSGTATDMVLDANGHPWSTSCGFDTVQAIRGDAVSGNPIDAADLAPDLTGQNAPAAGMCFWAGTPDEGTGLAEVVVCDPGIDCLTYTFDSLAAPATLVPVAVDAWAGRAIDYGQFHDGWHLLLETGNPGGRIEQGAAGFDVFTDYTLDSIDASWRDTDGDGTVDTLYTVGVGTPVIDDLLGPRVILAYGDPAGTLTERVLQFSDPSRPDLIPTGAGIYADDDRLVVAVAADSAYYIQDAVGWVFFGMP